MRDRDCFVPPNRYETDRWLGQMDKHRWRAVRAEEGTEAAARRLKKYGWGPEYTLRVLGIRPSHTVAVLRTDP